MVPAITFFLPKSRKATPFRPSRSSSRSQRPFTGDTSTFFTSPTSRSSSLASLREREWHFAHGPTPQPSMAKAEETHNRNSAATRYLPIVSSFYRKNRFIREISAVVLPNNNKPGTELAIGGPVPSISSDSCGAIHHKFKSRPYYQSFMYKATNMPDEPAASDPCNTCIHKGFVYIGAAT